MHPSRIAYALVVIAVAVAGCVWVRLAARPTFLLLYGSALLVWFGATWGRSTASANEVGREPDERRHVYVLQLALRVFMVFVGATTIFFIVFLLPKIV